jgi:serine/threonine protein kinase
LAYEVTERTSDKPHVLKVFASGSSSDCRERRTRFLVACELPSICAAIHGPTDLVADGSVVGHIASWAPGCSLDEFTEARSLLDDLAIACALSAIISRLHARGIAHGDIQGRNIHLYRGSRDVIEVHVFDLDNFATQDPAVPPPLMSGHILYMAPELRSATGGNPSARPDLATDAFSLGVILHEILLGCHPAHGVDGDEDGLERSLLSGRSTRDPANPARGDPLTDVRAWDALDARLQGLLRASLALDPARRPLPSVWEEALSQALWKLFACPGCRNVFVIDSSKLACPTCHKPLPVLAIELPSGVRIPIDRGGILIGREHLGGSIVVSKQHAVLHRMGPELRLDSIGRNGTSRWNGKQWIRLPERTFIRAGDRVRFADVETRIVEVHVPPAPG